MSDGRVCGIGRYLMPARVLKLRFCVGTNTDRASLHGLGETISSQLVAFLYAIVYISVGQRLRECVVVRHAQQYNCIAGRQTQMVAK